MIWRIGIISTSKSGIGESGIVFAVAMLHRITGLGASCDGFGHRLPPFTLVILPASNLYGKQAVPVEAYTSEGADSSCIKTTAPTTK